MMTVTSLYMPEGNLPSVLFAENEVSEDQPIWVDAETDSQTVTKSMARDLVRRLAHGYLSAGLVKPNAQPPSVVVLYSENQPIHFPNILAVIAAGGTVATCPWQATVDELAYRIKILRPTAILCSKSSVQRASQARAMTDHSFEILVQDSATMDVVGHDSKKSLLSHHRHSWDESWNEQVANRASLIVFSSGTTGFPKGVTISQRNIIAMVYQMRSRWSSILHTRTRWPRAVGTLDSSHVAGMVGNCFLPLGVGLTNYLVPGSNTDLLLITLEKRQINFMTAVPPILQRLTAHPGWSAADIPSLQHVIVGAARCPPDVQQAVTERMAEGAFCQQAWGMTELTCLATMPVPGALGPWESVGTALDGNRIKICGEDGTEVPVGQQGEVYISGPTKTNGYYGQTEEQRRQVFVDEWMRTGDLGHVDSRGYLFITGRNKDLIKYNGTQVSPLEIEGVVMGHNAVEDVAVVGQELEDGNELPTAFVVLKDDVDVDDPARLMEEIGAFTAKRVSPYKRLRGGVHRIPSIPRNLMGKVLYRELRAVAQALRQKAVQPKL